MEMNISYVRVTALMGKLDDAMVHGTTLPFTGEDIIDIYTILRDYQEQQDTKAGDNLRPQVAAFARLMEAELLKHDDRPGWKECDPQWLIKRLRGEADELAGALLDHSKSVGQEAADVANFAMMIVDVCGELDKDQQTKAGAISEEAAALMDSTAGHRATADLVADPSPGSLSSDDERDALKADYEYKNEQLGAAILRAEKAEAENEVLLKKLAVAGEEHDEMFAELELARPLIEAADNFASIRGNEPIPVIARMGANNKLIDAALAYCAGKEK